MIGETGERKSAVATPDGKRRKKKNPYNRLHQHSAMNIFIPGTTFSVCYNVGRVGDERTRAFLTNMNGE